MLNENHCTNGCYWLDWSSFVKAFLDSGDLIVGISRSADSLLKLQSELKDRSDQLHVISVDLSSDLVIKYKIACLLLI